MPKCTFDPKIYTGYPIGMFHCPECGQMVIAAMDHPDYDLLDDFAETELTNDEMEDETE